MQQFLYSNLLDIGDLDAEQLINCIISYFLPSGCPFALICQITFQFQSQPRLILGSDIDQHFSPVMPHGAHAWNIASRCASHFGCPSWLVSASHRTLDNAILNVVLRIWNTVCNRLMDKSSVFIRAFTLI